MATRVIINVVSGASEAAQLKAGDYFMGKFANDLERLYKIERVDGRYLARYPENESGAHGWHDSIEQLLKPFASWRIPKSVTINVEL